MKPKQIPNAIKIMSAYATSSGLYFALKTIIIICKIK